MNATRALRDPSPRQRHRLVMWLGVFTLILSLMSPLIAIQTAAAQESLQERLQGVPPDCDEGFEVDQATNTCVPITNQDQNQQLDQQPPEGCAEGEVPDGQGGCMADPNLVQCPEGEVPDGQGGCMADPNLPPPVDTYVWIDKYDCPTTADWSTVTDYAALTAPEGCVPNQMSVNMTVNGEMRPVTSTSEWGPYQDTTSHQISEEVPTGYNLPHWFCGGYDRNTTTVPPASMTYFGASAGVAPNVNPGESVYCAVFNHQPPAEQYGTLILHKYACPDGHGITDPGSMTYLDMSGLCTTSMPNVPFEYAVNGTAEPLMTDGSGMVQWDQAPTGQYTITETYPLGYDSALVYCSYHELNTANNVFEPWQMSGPAAIGGTMDPGYVLECHWYNLPGDQLQLNKYWCPPEVAELLSPGETDYQNACTLAPGSGQPAEQMTWRVAMESNDQEITSLAPSTDLPGKASYNELPQDQNVTIREQMPEDAGYGEPVAYCYEYQRGGNGQPSATYTYVPGTGVVWTPRDGYFLICNFYNIPAAFGAQDVDAYAIIQIEKYWCNEGYMPAEDAAQSDVMGSNECQPTGPETSLSLDGPGGPYDPQSLPDNGSNVAQWELTEGGTYTVTEDLPDDYRMLVYCHLSPLEVNGANGQADPQMWTVMNNNQIQWEAEEGYYWICTIFNLYEGGPHGVYVYKYTCPEGMTPPETPEGILDNHECTNPDYLAEDVSYDLVYGGASHPQDTGPEYAYWSGVPGGQWEIHETIPNGYGDPYVSCFLEAQNDSPTVDLQGYPMVAQGGMISGEMPSEGEYVLYCYFYNFLEDGNAVDFYKYVCAPDTPMDQDADYYGQNCERAGNYDFDLEYPDGSKELKRTTGEGYVGWDGVEMGTWSATEMVPADSPTPLVWCRYVEWPDEAGYDDTWFPMQLTDHTISHTFDYDNIRIECWWFNFEEMGNTVTLYKWDCDPGTMYGQEQTYYQGENGDPGPCDSVHGGLTARLYDGRPGSPHEEITSHNTPDWDGVELDENGAFRAEIDEPAGYGDPMVFCRTLDDEQSTMVDATGGMITITPAAEPFHYQCDWYNIPYEDGYHLELVKFTCDYTVDRTLGLPDLGTHPNCALDEGVSFTASFGMTPGSARYTDANGELSWPDAPGGPWSLTEGMMTGYQPPKVYCGPPETTEAPEVPVSMDWTITGTLDSTNPHIICVWFNFEEPIENGHVTVIKIQCPPGTEATDFGLLQETCTTPHNGVGFNLSGSGVDASASTSGGHVSWSNLDQGTYTITEDLWPGYGAPLVWCGYVMQDGAPIDPTSQEYTGYPVTDASIQIELSNFPAHLVCYWYNFPDEPGEITIHKWTCPPGYDLGAWGADPKMDCTQATNGVTFTLDQPMGNDLQTDTGDSIDGAVYFGGLNPGTYTVTEMVPPDTAYVFVLDCTGTDIPKVHQVPLSWGNKLDINVSSGDQIVCHWYNVPRPDTGWVTVYKYVCSTTTWVDKVYCVTYEKGQTFELFQVDGNVSKGTGITNAGGTYTWNDLAPGAYSIREDKGVPCKITASSVDGKGNAWVKAGEGTTIKVYNCTQTPGKVPPGKVPTKYPNTGVAPQAEFVAPKLQDAPEGTATPGTDEEAEAFYQVDCISGEVAATPPASTPEAETEATMPPIEAEPTETPPPTDGEAPATPPATPEVSEGECERGAIPQHLAIESVGIDADFEYLEIIDGLMEQPAGPELVAWYRDTARLGETNNVVVAGHLNWWNVPEGVFYRLQDLQEGDRVEVTGDDGMIYVYEVQWVRQESNLEPPGVDVIGPTDEQSLTLITCGGEWNADMAEYEERTVARAIQVEVIDADAAASSAAGLPLAA